MTRNKILPNILLASFLLLGAVFQSCMTEPDFMDKVAVKSNTQNESRSITGSPMLLSLDWSRVHRVVEGRQELDFIPIRDTWNRFDGSQLQEYRYMILYNNLRGRNQVHILEILTKSTLPSQESAAKELEYFLYSTLVKDLKVKPKHTNFTGWASLYDEKFSYVNGIEYSEGKPLKNFRLYVTAHASNGRNTPKSIVANKSITASLSSPRIGSTLAASSSCGGWFAMCTTYNTAADGSGVDLGTYCGAPWYEAGDTGGTETDPREIYNSAGWNPSTGAWGG